MRGESMADRVTTPIRYDIGKLDTRLKNQSIQKVVSGSNHSAILAGGKIFIRGEPEAHTMGRRINARHKVENSLNFDGLGLNKVEDLWCGGYHNIAKVKKGSTWHYFVWGLNRQGQLGLRTYEDIEYPQEL
jgi:alpha-tubulin suppressor-like RCC1 family protein